MEWQRQTSKSKQLATISIAVNIARHAIWLKESWNLVTTAEGGYQTFIWKWHHKFSCKKRKL
uniref:Uncharacterized protein n=1 Tax=Arundo donax TaxID=35708 RepID=A0A0A8Y4B4_ARUDO